MKVSKKILAVILSAVMTFSICTVAFSVSAKDDITPIVFLPGIGQSQTYKYDDEGNVIDDWNLFHVNTDFANYSLNDWLVFVGFVGSFVASLALQRDVIPQSAINALFRVLFRDHLRDENGEFIENVVCPNYPFSVKDYDEEAMDIFNSRIPCQELLDEIGEENVYVYNYSVFSNLDDNARGLNDYIEDIVLPQTGADKVILVPMSMGATVVNDYMDLYPDADRIEKVISIVGAWNGSDVFADLLTANFDENAPDLVYTDAINGIGLGDEYLGYIINIAARILPKQEVDNILYGAIEGVVNTIILPNTELISVCPSERYSEFADKYLNTPETAEQKEQTARYAEAQKNLEARLKYQEETYGTEFYFISGYDMKFGDADYGFFHYFESFDETNSDEVIQISSTAPGTSFVPAGQKFDDAYIADPAHHVSPDGSIDVSTCYYEKTSWYFRGQKHELTDNNTALALAFDIALNKVKTVDDCKDVYPQFNESRFVRRLVRNYLPDAKSIDLSKLEAADAQKLTKAINDAEAMLSETHNDREADDAVIEALLAELKEINAKYNLFENSYLPDEPASVGIQILTVVLKYASKILLQIFGKYGFADYWTRFLAK